MKFLSVLAFSLVVSNVQAANLVLSGIQNGVRTGERSCGPIGSVTNSDSQSVSIISKDGSCVCNLYRSLSIADTMELTRSDDRLSLICEASFDSVKDVGEPAEIMLANPATMSANNFRVVGKAR